jgi:hypothetical protein
MSTLTGAHATPGRSLNTAAQKTTFEPIRVPLDAIEAYRKSNPLFTEFLIESGRVIIEGNIPEELAATRRERSGKR